MLKHCKEVATSVSFTEQAQSFELLLLNHKSLCFSRIFSNCLQDILIFSFLYSVLLHSRKGECQILAELDEHWIPRGQKKKKLMQITGKKVPDLAVATYL